MSGVHTGPGAFYPPTVVTNLTNDMDITQRETFGPVASIRVVDSADEALRLANETSWGLGATVWTGDEELGGRLAEKLQAGMIGINRGLRGIGDSPWVGARQSGIGYSQSVDGIRQLLQVHTITRRVGA